VTIRDKGPSGTRSLGKPGLVLGRELGSVGGRPCDSPVPDEAHEALRDLVRARDDAKVDLLRAKHQLGTFLLRRAIQPPVGVRAWSRAHDAWLAGLTFEHAADRLIRQVLGRAAHNARYRPNVSTSLRARHRHLAGRIGTNKAIIAVARELAGFVWATGRLVPMALAA